MANSAASSGESMLTRMNSSRSSFTEAVPLSLSSMAHMAIPLTGGLLDGLKEVIQHTMLASVNYARKTIAPGQWTFGDIHLSHDHFHGKLVLAENNKEKLPTQLQKSGFRHEYIQEAFLFLGPPTLFAGAGDWRANNLILGRIVLHFTCKDMLTVEELDADEEPNDDMPETVLFKAEVEYRSLPPTGSQEAIEAEELSMLSFGYSIDDDVKYGALAALYDKHAKYVLEVFSVRGKKYKFDLMNATLSDGRVPRWNSDHSSEDPFVKSLCVTVTDHADNQSTTRLVFSLDGNLRVPLEAVPNFHYYANELKNTFLWSTVATLAMPSRQALLLDVDHMGKVFVHGKYMTTWGVDGKIGSHAPALFGMDLHAIPIWHGRIVDYEFVKQAYSTIWREVLIDARLADFNLASRLLSRLMYGKDDDGYDDEDDVVDTSMECLESQLMSSSNYDPVGICAKALATKFQQEFGKAAFPCTELEVDTIKRCLGHRYPIVVPARLISVLRRGGFFDWKRTMEELWFTNGVRPAVSEAETKLVSTVVGKLSHHMELSETHVVFVKIDDKDPIAHRNMCRYNWELKKFYVNDQLLSMEKSEFWLGYYICEEYSPASLRDYLEHEVCKR